MQMPRSLVASEVDGASGALEVAGTESRHGAVEVVDVGQEGEALAVVAVG